MLVLDLLFANICRVPRPGPPEPGAQIIHRELVQLVQLGLLAVAAFLLTRALAASTHAVIQRDAATWYERGAALAARGDLAPAIAAFRRASALDHHQPRYVLALADALAQHQDNDTARALLLTLRESMPEHADVNLRLARLATARHDVTEALHYYRHTLYATWNVNQEGRRRRVRLELIDFLLGHQQANTATAELIAVSADTADEPAAHMELASRFARAGDQRRALAQFQGALRRSPREPAALAGAGEAAFELGEYELARRYFRSTARNTPALADKRELVDLVLAGDPLAPRLGARQRRTRLAADLAYARERLAACPSMNIDTSPAANVSALRQDSEELAARLRSPGGMDMDSLEEGVDLIARIEREAARTCAPSLRDRALLLIAERHAEGRR